MSFASCSSDDEPRRADDMPIAFANGSLSEVSRSDTPLEDVVESFKVRVLKTTADDTQIVMGAPGDFTAAWAVRFFIPEDDVLGWHYHGIGTQTLRYWDLSARRYDFSAYAPETLAGVSFTAANDMNFTNIEGNISITSPEPLIAIYSREVDPLISAITDTDCIKGTTVKTPSAMTEDVNLVFHHLLSQVNFLIYTNGEPFDVTDFKIESTDTKFVTKGDYSTETDTWTPVTMASDVADITYNPTIEVSGTDMEHASLLMSSLQVPQSLPDGSVLALTVTIDGNPVEIEITPEYLQWKSDTCYLYYLAYDAGDDSFILVDLKIKEWLKAEEINHTQTNW